MTYSDVNESNPTPGPMVPEGFDTTLPMNRHVTTDERDICFATMTPDEFKLDDVPHALSKICRYNGLINRFYSVAQHSVMVCELAEAFYGKGDISFACLMHDAVEAYLGDISRPFKALLPDYQRIEKHVEGVICEAMNMSTDPALWKEVKRFDVMALHIEANNILCAQYPWVKPMDNLWTQSRMAHKLVDGQEMLPAEAKRAMWSKLNEYGYFAEKSHYEISRDPSKTNPLL